MTTETVAVVPVAALLVALSAVGWLPGARSAGLRVVALALVAGLAALGLAATLTGPIDAPQLVRDGLLVDLFLVAVVGGGPVTTAVLGLADGRDEGAVGTAHAEQVLRGGAWIGAFERVAVFSTLAAGWPEGLAVVLALKGLGRYSELRSHEAGGVAERFLIGTFASTLWAVACAGALAGLTR